MVEDGANFLNVDKKGNLFLNVYVQPKSSRTRIAGLHGNAVKMCITEPPVEGKANATVIKFLAKLFHIPKSAITLHSGQQNRTKRFLLANISYDAVDKTIKQHIKTNNIC